MPGVKATSANVKGLQERQRGPGISWGLVMMLAMVHLNKWQCDSASPDTYPMVQPASASMVQMQLRLCS